jgi:allophanate hydrolase
VFALTAADAVAVLEVAGGPDPADPFGREAALRPPRGFKGLVLGVPRPGQLEFFGDAAAGMLYQAALARAEALGARLVEVDLAPFLETAELLYAGPWIAERAAAVGDFIAARPEEVWPTTRGIIAAAGRFTAVDAFKGLYRLMEFARATAPVWQAIDALLVPTAPTIYRAAELEAEPVLLNSRLGTYTNFVNLLDLAAVAVPAGFRPDGLPSGVTLVGPAWSDRMLAGLAQAWQRATGLTLGATGATLPDEPDLAAAVEGLIELAVVGAHLSGEPLNHQLVENGGELLLATRTAACYRLHALEGASLPKPGLVRVMRGEGASVEVEVWRLPADGLGRLLAGVPAPLAIGTVELADGREVKGFLCEAYAVRGSRDITALGGWRAFRRAQAGAG